MQNNLERINPDTIGGDETLGRRALELHLERYRFAARHIREGLVADIACGVGYGSFLLVSTCERINHIYAVDNDRSSIEFAANRYAHPRITFIATDATAFCPPEKLQSIVSLETLEHLADPRAFVRQMADQLQVGGTFIGSVPVTPSMDANPYHLHDFSINQFKKMFLSVGMKEIESIIQTQPYSLTGLLSHKEERSKDLRKNMAGYYLRNPSKILLRMRSLLKDGLNNKYIVAAFEKI